MMLDTTSITHAMLEDLRERVQKTMSPKRYTHTCAVECMVARLCELFCPECTLELRAAALLHDITKEESLEKQLQLCREFDIIVKSGDVLAPKTFHAKTAAALIGREYPAFASEAVINAVRWHTTGHENMTLGEQLLYLADYIDDSRMFPDCVRLRNYFWRADPAAMDEGARIAHLYDTLIMSFDMTMRHLLDENATISLDTILARNALIEKKTGL